MTVTALLKNPKGPVKQGNPNTCAEAKSKAVFILCWVETELSKIVLFKYK